MREMRWLKLVQDPQKFREWAKKRNMETRAERVLAAIEKQKLESNKKDD